MVFMADLSRNLAYIIDFIAVILISIASFWSVYDVFISFKNDTKIDVNQIRFRLGYGIILGLEFMIGADIIESSVNRSYYELGILAFTVFIRTVLSYFLNKELESLSGEQRKQLGK